MKNKTTPTTTSRWLLILMVSPLVFAQENPEDSRPTAETEIICYAAKTKWVCAPADEKQRAHDKAVAMAAEASSDDSQTADSVIRSQADNQLVNQEPVIDTSVYQENVRDFSPRTAEPEATQTDPANTVTAAPAEEVPAAQAPVVRAEETAATEMASMVVTNNPTPVSADNNDFNDWQARYPNHWSLQVVGTSNRHKLDAFIRDQGLSQNTYAIVKTQVNQADWWVVLVGLYTSREAALANRDSLPGSLSGSAWVRQIGSINGAAD